MGATVTGIDASNILVFAGILIAFGLVTCFYGFAVYRIYLTIVGVIAGALLGMALAGDNQGAQVIAAVIGALIGGVLGYLLYIVGVVVAGITLGLTVGFALATALQLVGNTALIVAVICAVLGAFLAFFLAKIIIMLSTAFSGAAQVVLGVLLLLPSTVVGVNSAARTANMQLDQTTTFAALAGILVLGIVGFSWQYRRNRRKVSIS
jgi:hypothetical protein